jgi:predicted MFS family arabinose efflux permease
MRPLAKGWEWYRNRDFFLFWSGETVSTLGSQISLVAYPLLVLGLTHSAADAGVVGFAGRLPWLVLALPAGTLADRWSRKRVMLVSDGVRALALASIAVGLLIGRLSFVQIVIVAFVEGTSFVFFGVCARGAVRQIVAVGRVPEAVARLEAKDYGAVVAGPAVGGVLYDLGRMWPFVADALSYVASVVTLLLIRQQFEEPRTNAEDLRLRDLGDGLRWLWGQSFLRTCQLLVAGSNLVWGGLYLAVVVIAKREGASGSSVGIMFTIAGAGGLAGALVAPRLLRRVSLRWAVLGSHWVSALLLPLILVAPGPLVIGIILASMLWVAPVWNAGVVGYRTAVAPDRLQGRIQGAASLIAQGASSVGPLLAGFALAGLGSTATIVALAFFSWLLAVTATLSRSVRHAPTLAGAQT